MEGCTSNKKRSIKFARAFVMRKQSEVCTTDGDIAQLVEQWTENPCVAGSIPAITTIKGSQFESPFLFPMIFIE